MTLVAPFPYFGGKRQVAAEVWARFGEVTNYVEPFAGSLAVLLARPEPIRSYGSRCVGMRASIRCPATGSYGDGRHKAGTAGRHTGAVAGRPTGTGSVSGFRQPA